MKGKPREAGVLP